MDEAAALKAASRGDKDAFRILVEAYQDRLFGHVLSMVSRRDVAEDLTQEIFVKAYFALDRFKGDSTFFTWIYRIASNHCLDFLRRKKLPETPLDAPLAEDSAQSLSDALPAPLHERPDAAVTNEAHLADLLDALDPEYKLILVLRELEGHSYEELTAMLDAPMNTVKSRLNRAREALKAVYVRKYGPIPRGNILQESSVKDHGETPL
jgi:RNA polymerase sigma-70 factor (ECF subfamily)